MHHSHEHFKQIMSDTHIKLLRRFNLQADNSLLLVIDEQDKLLNVMYNTEEVKKNTKILLEAACLLGIPTVLTEQNPKGLGPTNSEILSLSKDAALLHKMQFSALNYDLKSILTDKNRHHIIIAGIESHICVYQTVRDLLADGRYVTVVRDATGSRTKENHKNGLTMMRSMRAVISNTEGILFDLLKTSSHEHFKAISKLIK